MRFMMEKQKRPELPQTISAVIFDLDGTLIDSIPDIARVSNAALNEYGLEPYPDQEYRAMVGWGLLELSRRALAGRGAPSAPTADQLTKRIVELYEQYPYEHGAVYEGIRGVLHRLKTAGIKCAVLTNKRHEVAVQTVALAFPDMHFGCVRGDREGAPRKPAPETVQEVLDALSVEASHTVLVGDSDVDMHTAQAANLYSIGVAWGYRGREHLIDAGACVVVDTAQELLRALGSRVEPASCLYCPPPWC